MTAPHPTGPSEDERPRRPSWMRLLDDRAFGLIEVSVAMGVLSVAVIGVAGAGTTGLVAAGQARQRTVAAAVANDRIERARLLPYDQVALDETPVHASDTSHPDYHVAEGAPARYDVLRNGTAFETIASGGMIKHAETGIVRGHMKLDVHQYVTWVDEPAIVGTQDYKRLTAIVTWTGPLAGGASRTAVASTFLAPVTLSLTETSLASAPPSASPTPTASPAPTSSCAGDAYAPTGTLEIMSGTGATSVYTNSTVVQARVEATDTCEALRTELSNDGVVFSPAGELVSGASSTVAWMISSGDGAKTIHSRFIDGAGNVSQIVTATTVLDQTPPTVPADLRKLACTTSGSDRQVRLGWNQSADTNASGYRVYRSINAEAWMLIATASTEQVDDTTRRNLDSVRYSVRAYDRAGNESGETNVIVLSKNKC